MSVCGLDLGSRSCRAVLVTESGEITSRAEVSLTPDLPETARLAIEQFGARRDDVQYVAATGFGRYQVPFRDLAITEVSCHAFGAHALVPSARTALDLGAQGIRAMRFGDDGRVVRFRANEACAGGSGRFLERMARTLDLPLAEIGPVSLRAQAPVPVSSVCTVLADSEIIHHVTEGRAVEDILMGAHLSIADRVVGLARQAGVEGDIALTGALSRNTGLVAALVQKLGARVRVPPDAEYAGALGAALLALKRVRRLERDEQIHSVRNG